MYISVVVPICHRSPSFVKSQRVAFINLFFCMLPYDMETTFIICFSKATNGDNVSQNNHTSTEIIEYILNSLY